MMDLNHTISVELARMIEHVPIGGMFTVAPSSDFCFALELYIPKILMQHYSIWKSESIDGFFVASATRTGLLAAEMYGTCILITDQTCTPFLLQVELSQTLRCVKRLHVSIGEPGGGRLAISGPKCTSKDAKFLLDNIHVRISSIDWSFEVLSDECISNNSAHD